MKIMFKYLLLTLLIPLAVVAILSWKERVPDKFKDFKGDFFNLRIPDNFIAKETQEQKWKGYYFKGYGNASLFYYKRTAGEKPEEVLEMWAQKLKFVKYQKDLKLLDGAKFLLIARGKMRRYIYIINSGPFTFWLENGSYYSTLRGYKDVVDKMAISLEINGQGSSKEAELIQGSINSEILKYSQSSTFISFILMGVVTFILILVFILIYFTGKLPKGIVGSIIQKEEYVYIAIKKKFFYKGVIGSIVLTDKDLTAYTGKKILFQINNTNADANEVHLGKKRGKRFVRYKKDELIIEVFVIDPLSWMNKMQSFR